MKRAVIFFLCWLFLMGGINTASALESKIKNIKVEERQDSLKVIFETESTVRLVVYDTVEPAQIIVDVIGDGLTNVSDKISVNTGVINQIAAFKTSSGSGEYYWVDFWVIDLTESVDYDFFKQDGKYTLLIAKEKGIMVKEDKAADAQAQPWVKTGDYAADETDLDKKVSCVKKVSYQSSPKAFELRQKGYRCQLDGNYNMAKDFYQKAIEEDAGYASAYNDLGIIYDYLKDSEKAVEQFKKALEVDPNYAGAYTNLAVISEKLNKKKEAVNYWSKRAGMGNTSDYWTNFARQKEKELKGN